MILGGARFRRPRFGHVEGMDAMIRFVCSWIVRTCVGEVTSWPWPDLLTGLGCGFLLLCQQQQFFSQLGNSQVVTTTAGIAICAAWALAWGRRRGTSDGVDTNLQSQLALPLLLVSWTLISPWIWGAHERFFHDAILTSRWSIAAYAMVWALITLGLPAWCTGRLALRKTSGERDSNASSAAASGPIAGCVLGISIGLGTGLFINWGSLYVTAAIGGAVLLAAQIWTFLKPDESARSTAVESTSPSENSRLNTPDRDFGAAVIPVACGGLAIWSAYVFGLLLPATIFTSIAIISGLLCGVACGSRLKNRPAATEFGAGVFTCCLLATMLLVLCAGFSEVVFRFVTLTGSISQVWLLHSVRWGFIACCTIPLGYAWASAMWQLTRVETRFSGPWGPRAWGFGVLLALVGGLLSQSVLIPFCGLTLTCYVWLWTIAGVHVIEGVRRKSLPRLSLVRGLAVGCLAALIVCPVLCSGVRPELAGRVLFSTNVFRAEQSGTPASQLAFIDEARLEVQMPGERGVFTVWKSTVARHQVRENGIPRGVISTNTEISPQDTSEVVLALLPLSLHAQPSRVALLGLGASAPLDTCLACPIMELTAVETDPALVSLLQQVTEGTEAAAQWNDERLTLKLVDPALWVAGSGTLFDVVISNPDQSALVQGASQFTQEFYRRTARRLAADGIFCQRFQFHDYGAAPLQTMAATLRSVFKHVLAVEMGQGEIAWLATNSTAGFIRTDVVDRMQAPHVRQLMAKVGWDWSVLLTLGAYDDAGLAKIAAGKAGQINTAANGCFCTQLPSELMRWGNKSLEIQDAVTVHVAKILDWVGDAGTGEDLLRRLGEVRGQQELVAKYPDQYWGYRSQVKKQISSRPLSRIQQVKHEVAKDRGEQVGLHPDDKRRLRYFQQLSAAIHSRQATDLEKLAQFDAPYDPLISLFMHQELAEIAAEIPELPSSLELNHRLHMLYFAPSTDTSVRNALSALRLVLEKPQSVASNADRWDVIGSLLQMLQARWENRSPELSGNASLAARDVEINIVLVERALEELPKLASDVGFSQPDVVARTRNIQRNLLRPLRAYREELQPLASKQRFDAQEDQLDGGLPSEEDLQFPGSETVE